MIFLISGFVILPAQKQQNGKASYYSKRATGARTSSGERLHHDSLVCAHRTFPFGTKLKVTNLSNGKWVIVRVIDRGPFLRGRVIDLSYAAAKAIGMLSQGVAAVQVERVDDIVIPFRPEEEDWTEFDYETIERGKDDVPVWHEDVKRIFKRDDGRKK